MPSDLFDQYLDNIRQVCDPAQIDYIILNHCEPDHSGVLGRLTSLCPAAKNSGQPGRIPVSEEHHQQSFPLPITVAKDGDKLDLGGKNPAVYFRAVSALARFHVHLVSRGKNPFLLRCVRRPLLRALYF